MTTSVSAVEQELRDQGFTGKKLLKDQVGDLHEGLLYKALKRDSDEALESAYKEMDAIEVRNEAIDRAFSDMQEELEKMPDFTGFKNKIALHRWRVMCGYEYNPEWPIKDWKEQFSDVLLPETSGAASPQRNPTDVVTWLRSPDRRRIQRTRP
jgi:hypothetical protein